MRDGYRGRERRGSCSRSYGSAGSPFQSALETKPETGQKKRSYHEDVALVEMCVRTEACGASLYCPRGHSDRGRQPKETCERESGEPTTPPVTQLTAEDHRDDEARCGERDQSRAQIDCSRM